jgi:hypothetical protein
MRLIPVLLLLILSGCAKQYGNFIEKDKNEAWLNRALASEFAQLLNKQKPAAWTKVTFKHETADLFGQSLVNDLRRDGYAVAEFHPDSDQDDGLKVYYKVDHFDIDEFVVSVFVGKKRLSRVYAVSDNTLIPTSVWTSLEVVSK